MANGRAVAIGLVAERTALLWCNLYGSTNVLSGGKQHDHAVQRTYCSIMLLTSALRCILLHCTSDCIDTWLSSDRATMVEHLCSKTAAVLYMPCMKSKSVEKSPKNGHFHFGVVKRYEGLLVIAVALALDSVFVAPGFVCQKKLLIISNSCRIRVSPGKCLIYNVAKHSFTST